MVDLLRCPGYAVPLGVNLTGSVWFFLLIGKAGEFWRGFSLGERGWGGGGGGGGWGLRGAWGGISALFSLTLT